MALAESLLAPSDAEHFLLASARISDTSPAQRTYGPDLGLAQDLLEVGRRQVVGQYLQACREFWSLGRELLDTWIRDLRDGATPTLDKSELHRTMGFRDASRLLRDGT
jgi:hypothetical protein